MGKLTVSIDVEKSDIQKLKQEERELRREASRKASMANKRLKRLEEQGLTKTSAYKSWFDNGGVKFGVRGKSKRQVQMEMARLDKFLNMQTSTVGGAKKNLESIANRIELYNWDNYKDLEKQIANYYELQNKVLEYSRNIKEIGVSLNYQKVGEVVSDYLKETNGVMFGTGEEVLELTKKTVEAIGRGKMSEVLDDLTAKMENMLKGL